MAPLRSYPDAERLPTAFFARPSPELARRLLGCHLVSRMTATLLALRIVEVEAYLGEGRDAASHAHRGPTARNRQMFETPGRLYVYFTYGMHHCMNVVCEEQGRAGAVLLRAAEPLQGESLMRRRRGRGGRELSNGPAKLCQALGLDLTADGMDLASGPLGIWPGSGRVQMGRSTRIGISRARELPLRFFDSESPFVSRTRPAGNAL
jgi:DNA-3-methyladenine glycosylase